MRKIYFLLLTIVFASVTSAQVSVTATAGTTGPTAYTNLSSAFTAINAGTHQGVITVNITASFADAAVSVLNSSGAGSASYTSVLVQPATDGVTMSFATATGRGVIELNGADNVTIDGDNPNTPGTNRNLTIANTAANTITFTSVIRLATSTLITSANNNIIRNLNLNGSGTGRNTSSFTSEVTTWGVIASAGASTVAATTAPSALSSATTTVPSGQTHTALLIDNNNIQTVARGISLNGSSNTVAAGFLVTNNTIGNQTVGAADQVTAVGITVQGSTDGIVRGNTVRVEGFIGSSTPNRVINVGMVSTAGASGITIERNRVGIINNYPNTWTASGIDITGGNNHIIQNNFVFDCLNSQVTGTGAFSTTFGAFGIRILGGTGHKIYHNSVHFSGVVAGSTSSNLVAAIALTTSASTGMDIRNNIFSNRATGGNPTGFNTTFTNVYMASGLTSGFNLTWNNNIYFQGTLPNSTLAQVGTTSGTGVYLAANFNSGATTPSSNFRSYTSTLSAAGTNDNASIATTTAPPFVSNTDLHIPAGTPTIIESAGAAVGLTTDIDGDTRPNGTAPDAGADEFAGIFVDLTAPSIVFTPPAPMCTVGDIAVNGVIISDASGVPTAGGTVPRIYYSKNGGAYVSSPGTLASGTGTNGTWNFTILAANLGGLVSGDNVSYYIIAQDIVTPVPNISSNPSGVVATDVNTVTTHPASPVTVLSGSLSGTYTVGAGGNFTTLTAAVSAYNVACLSGPVVFNLTDATYPSETFPITINPNSYASATNTLTIKPAISATITGSSTVAIIHINGADYITIDGSATMGTATDVGGDAALRNLTIQNTNTSTASAVLFVGSGTDGAHHNTLRNLNVLGNDPTQTLLGISLGGNTPGTAGTDNDNNRVENCSVQKAIFGIYNVGQSAANPNTGTVITMNDLSGSGANRVRRGGIFIFNENGAQVTANRIANVSTDESADAIGIIAGIQSISTTATTSGGVFNSLISRNVIAGIASTSTTGFSAAGIAIAGDAAGANIVSNNMISGVTAPSTSPDLVAGIFVAGVTGSNTQVYHNTVFLSGDRGAVASQIGSYGIAITGTNPTVDLRDNIFYTTQTSGGGANAKSYALGMVSTTFTNLTSNYNDFYFSGANAAGFRTGSLAATGTDYATLAAWQAATGKDANSLNVEPVFVSPTDLHLVPASNNGLNNLGEPLAAVTIDIDGQARSTSSAPQGPDMGADEFVGNCTGAEGGTASGGTTFCGSGTPTITATGYSLGTDAGYQWQSSTDNFVSNIVDIAGQTDPATLTTGVVSTTTYYRLRVTCPTGTALDYSNTVVVEVNSSPIISTDPGSTAVCAGATASFSVALSNPGPFTYQWQENTGSGFNNIPGANASTLAFPATAMQNGYQYRVLVTNSCGTTTSGAATLTVSANPVATIAYGQTLYASDNAGNLYVINTTTGAGTLIGNFDGTTIGSTEIEFNHNTGKAYAQGSGSNSIYEFNINTGAYIGPVVNTGAVHAGLEFVNNTLYGTSFIAPLGPSSFTVLNPVTGVSTPVGLTGIGTIAGLAYDLTSGIMYGIAGGGGPAGLYTINMSTGAATLIGSTGIQAGSLEFGPDGRLYAGGTGATNAGNIYTINTITGAATLLGATGTLNGITGLALANVPAVFCSNAGTVPVILTGSTGGTFTSAPAGLSIDAGTGAVNTNTSTNGNYTVTYTIPAVGTCPQVIASAPITINSAPVVAPITGPSTVCTGQTITLSSTTPGGTWTSTNTSAATVDPNTGVVTGVAAGSTTINYSVVAGCTTVVSAGVSVLAGPPTPVITPAAPVICAGTVQPLSISSGASTVTFSGGAITLPAGAPTTTSGPAGPYPSVIAVSGLPTAGVTVKSVTINGLTHTFPGDLDILLQSPTATNVVLMSDVGGGVDATGQNYTFDDAAAGLMSFTALNPTGSYRPSNNGTPDTWIAPGPGAITQAIPALSMFTGNFNGNWNLFAVDDAGGDVGSITSWSITFDVSPIIWSPLTGLFTDAAGTIPYTGTSTSTVYASPATTTTYTASSSSGGCTASGTVTVTVNPVPDVNAVSNQAVCHGSSVAAINFTGTVPGTVYSWTNSAPSIGLAASGTGNIASFTGTNTGTTPVVATITVTPTYTNAGTTCTGTPRTFTITVNPILSITTQPVNTVVCAGVNTTFSVAVSGAPTYQWQINQGSGFTNLTNTAPFSGVNTNTLVITSPTISLSGSQFQVVITSPCGNATSGIASLTVNPLPTISVGPSGQCAPVVLTATGTSDTYSWSPATGLNTTTGPTVTASPTGNTVYTVTGTITATGCQNSATATVLGTPPAVVVTPANPSICAGAIQQLTVPSGTGTYTSSGTITVPFGAPTTTSGPALPYPSTISVSGLPTSGVTVRSVTINGVTHTFPGDLDILLQSPTSTNVVLMSDVGGGTDATGQNFTFEDGAANLMSTTAFNPTGTYRPTNGGATDTWVAPGPGSITQATPLLSSFSGNPNGNWGLYIVDDAGGDAGSITNWSITFNLPTATWSPAVGLFTDPNATVPYVAGTVLNTVYASPTATTTYTVTGVLGTCSVPSGTVTVTVNPRPTISVTPNNQCGPVTLTASGTSNTYSWSPAAGLSATTGATVTANPTVNTVYTVTGTITNTGCTNTATVTVNATPPAPVVTPTSVSICSGAIATLTAASGNGTATATSGTISVAIPDNNPAGANHTLAINSVPAGATITDVSVNFNVTHTFDGDLILNLKAPNNNVLNLVNRRGGAGDNFVNTTISSTASSPISGGTAPFTGTYSADGANAVGPTGYVSNVTAFSGLTSIPNGNWTLAISDNAGADLGTLTSWTVNITYTLPNAIWTPVTGLFTNPTATIPYVAGTPLNTVYAKPTTTTTYSVTRTTGTCTSPASTVTVTVIAPIAITTQPASVTTCAGANATFSVVATGNLLTYQWQISTDGGTTWSPIAGATGASLVVPSVTTTMTNNRYRVVITNSCSTVTSSAATLTVNALTAPTVTPLTNRICLSDTLVPLVGLPAGGTWTGVGVSGSNFVPSATAVGTYTLTYTYRNAQNCTASATVVAKVEDCPERLIRLTDNAVILYPNPNDGLFNIRINSTLYNYLGMRVYNVQGQLLRIQNFSGLVYGRVIPVDLRNLPGGTYMVKFYYDDGVRTSDKTFKVVIAR